jgi:hypothetical protein
MDENLRAVVYGLVGVVGLVVLYAAVAAPPLFASQAGSGDAVASDTGVHLDDDGTIDYYRGDSFTLYEHALPVFLFTAAVGFGLFAKSSKELLTFARDRRGAPSETGQGSNTGS